MLKIIHVTVASSLLLIAASSAVHPYVRHQDNNNDGSSKDRKVECFPHFKKYYRNDGSTYLQCVKYCECDGIQPNYDPDARG